ncbi:MAG: radical SAM protein, partial [Anaerolineales bacterium]|nr:radical SAM protein [Anaerolineales bacterium]
IVPLAQTLAQGAPWENVPGLAHRGLPVHANPPPLPLKDLDVLPFPARDDGIAVRNGVGFATVAASRGCYHACAFCLPCAMYRQSPGPTYRLRSVPNLLDEIETLYHEGTRLFLFDDEQFLPPRPARAQRVDELGAGLRRRGLEIALTIKCRPDDVDDGLFRQLQAMGLIRVYLGVEAGNQPSLDRMAKGLTPSSAAEALALLDEIGIVADFRCLISHPWSTHDGIRADIEFLQQVAAHVSTPLSFREVICYPGTPLAAALAAEGGGEGAGWLLPYRIGDPSAELLRRLARLVFGARDAAGGLAERFSEAWFDVLLAQRFGRYPHAGRNRPLRTLVERLNRASLGVWQEMISFTTGEDRYDARQVNDCAARWATQMRALDHEALSDLGVLQAPSPHG